MPDIIGHYIEDLRFEHPCCLLVSGASGAGKSDFIKSCIEHNGIKGEINQIFYFMPKSEETDITPQPNQRIYVMEGLPTQKWVDDLLSTGSTGTMVVIDDQWRQCLESQVIEDLIIRTRRHKKISLAFITQNFFQRTPANRSKTLR